MTPRGVPRSLAECRGASPSGAEKSARARALKAQTCTLVSEMPEARTTSHPGPHTDRAEGPEPPSSCILGRPHRWTPPRQFCGLLPTVFKKSASRFSRLSGTPSAHRHQPNHRPTPQLGFKLKTLWLEAHRSNRLAKQGHQLFPLVLLRSRSWSCHVGGPVWGRSWQR